MDINAGPQLTWFPDPSFMDAKNQFGKLESQQLEKRIERTTAFLQMFFLCSV